MLSTTSWMPILSFLGTSIAATILIRQGRQQENDQEESKTTMRKDAVKILRDKFWCKSVSISYANSGPLMIVRGVGSRLIDETGISYLDTRNNVGHCGHSHPRVVKAVQDQVAQLNTNTRYLHPTVATLGERLCNLLPDPLEVVFFVNSGSEANDLALRLARAYTKSQNTIVVDGAYHGHTNSVLEVSPYKYEHSKEFELKPPKHGVKFVSPGKHIWKVPAPDIYRGLYRDIKTAGRDYAKSVEEACNFYQKECGEKVGAFIVEGGMSVAGVILPPPGYLARSVKAVRDAGGVYIADEVQTGFGRLGTDCFWAFQYHHDNTREKENTVVPDIVTMGKPFGNGMPLAALVTTKKISSAFESMGVEYFNTFGGNPVCAAAGVSVLDIIKDEHLQRNASVVGEYLKSQFLRLKSSWDIIGDVRGSGFFLGVELVRDRTTLEPATEETSFICSILKEKYHILTSIDGSFENVFVVKPPMVFCKSDADYFIRSFESTISDLVKIQDIKSMTKTPT